MKIPTSLRASVAAAALCCGCQSLQVPTLSQQQIADLTATAQQLQQLYAQIEPHIPAIQEAVQQLMKDEAIGGTAEALSNGRSPQWRAVRDRYAAAHPCCEFCGRAAVDVHHIQPFHLFPTRELDPNNLISLCRPHHFIYGHAGDSKCENPDVLTDKEFWRAVRAVTPTKEDVKP